MKQYILSLDQGTTSSRAILFEGDKPVQQANVPLPLIYPQSGWVEADPLLIYYTTMQAVDEVLRQSGVSPNEIAAIGIANQRETTILWDKRTGEPVCNAIIWQCRRSAGICDSLKERGMGGYIAESTGLVIDAYFSATKIKWLLDNDAALRQRAESGEIAFGTVDSWLLHKLTGVHVTDRTNASRTMLYNINSLKWDENILAMLDIPRAMLPEVAESSCVYGYANIGGARIPVAGIAGDQQAALFGQGCFSYGQAKNTYGTGCFLLINTGDTIVRSRNGLISTIAISLGGKVSYALEGSVFVAGAIVQWLRDEMGLIGNSSDIGKVSAATENTGGVYIVPAFTGMGAPYWNMHARGTITGITRATRREHIIRAAEESIAYQTNDLWQAMRQDLDSAPESLNADGGGSNDSFLMQFQSDILGVPIQRPAVSETTALGAAYLAGLAVGVWGNIDQIKPHYADTFAPTMSSDTREHLLNGWHNAIRKALHE